ncbi:hypothetical protein H6G33_35915 [Calothrix sp. FACHB-1219]|uniref:hypothetical protein n=1 Tax=unclassified Calothrix TaxID=2619626 RepID=UPI001684B201|nr:MULTISPECIES: hypothetical protein [unclassified Calothrix]MBD2207746.1 hypothetical protein [Calothrix sp. FACHB-168]MBD2222321.1 hypothetical protein [Calothrix sp. FACHB-1219]
MHNNILESARNGDIQAIACLIEQAIFIKVEAKIEYRVTLLLNIKSPDPKICARIISVLETIKTPIKSIHIAGINWHKYFALHSDKYVDNTNLVRIVNAVVFGLIGGTIAMSDIFYPHPTPVIAKASTTLQRTFQGHSEAGYELWADKSCIYVKGIKESDFARLKTTSEGYKQVIKQQTGFQCVKFE